MVQPTVSTIRAAVCCSEKDMQVHCYRMAFCLLPLKLSCLAASGSSRAGVPRGVCNTSFAYNAQYSMTCPAQQHSSSIASTLIRVVEETRRAIQATDIEVEEHPKSTRCHLLIAIGRVPHRNSPLLRPPHPGALWWSLHPTSQDQDHSQLTGRIHPTASTSIVTTTRSAIAMSSGPQAFTAAHRCVPLYHRATVRYADACSCSALLATSLPTSFRSRASSITPLLPRPRPGPSAASISST